MDRYSYVLVTIESLGTFNDKLNELSALGWRYVDHIEIKDSTFAVLERLEA